MGYKTYNCDVSKRCGGCEWLAVPYPIQLKRKQEEIEGLFKGFRNARINPIIGMDEPLHCRNKIIVCFTSDKSGKVRYGLYEKRSHRIIERSDCIVEDERAKPILNTLAKLATSFKLSVYNEETGYGFLRYALLRIGKKTGEVLVCLVANGETLYGAKAFVRKLREAHPEVKTVVLNVNKRNTNVVLGERERVLYGPGFIEDELLGCRFRISSTSFFQVNPTQTERLYSKAIELAGLDDTQTLIDAYCGIGTIGLIASKHAAQVFGVEVNKQAIKDARSNASRNRIENATFIAEDAGKFMRQMAADRQRADVVILDPPRSGSDERFLASLCEMRPKRVVYISCNPKTQVRDVEFLEERGYKLLEVTPVDMFPHTKHVETVVSLSRQ